MQPSGFRRRPTARSRIRRARNGPGYGDRPYGTTTGYDEPGREPDYRDDAYWQSTTRPSTTTTSSSTVERAMTNRRRDSTDSTRTSATTSRRRARSRRTLRRPVPRRRAPAQRRLGGGEWTGSHRAITASRRGVSVGVIAALVTVVVVVGAVILWRFFGDALSNRSAGRRPPGASRARSPSPCSPTRRSPTRSRTLAEQYNQSAAPVGDKCVKVGVKSADSDHVVDGFVGTWPAELGERPALWIPGSSVSEARLEAAAGRRRPSATAAPWSPHP